MLHFDCVKYQENNLVIFDIDYRLAEKALAQILANNSWNLRGDFAIKREKKPLCDSNASDAEKNQCTDETSIKTIQSNTITE